MRVRFNYKNYRGEIRERFVEVESLDYIPMPGFGYEAGWFLGGIDIEKNAFRSFALTNILIEGNGRLLRLLDLRKGIPK